MYALNHRVSSALQTASQVRLLCEKDELKTYAQLKRDVARLSNMFHTFEDWGITDSFAQIDDKMYKEAKDILERLRRQCSSDPNTDSEVPDRQVQHMLANLGLGKIAIYAFTIPVDVLKGKARE